MVFRKFGVCPLIKKEVKSQDLNHLQTASDHHQSTTIENKLYLKHGL